MKIKTNADLEHEVATLKYLLRDIISAKGVKSRMLAVKRAEEVIFPPIKNENTGAFWKERLNFWRK